MILFFILNPVYKLYMKIRSNNSDYRKILIDYKKILNIIIKNENFDV